MLWLASGFCFTRSKPLARRCDPRASADSGFSRRILIMPWLAAGFWFSSYVCLLASSYHSHTSAIGSAHGALTQPCDSVTACKPTSVGGFAERHLSGRHLSLIRRLRLPRSEKHTT
mmetsp:Transcript_88498/g.222790  ORF Transcript_88498/g.222790 Transcript_88498/m.222790 type:complete len:116 (-) Transcript_88498:18-365(-)